MSHNTATNRTPRATQAIPTVAVITATMVITKRRSSVGMMSTYKTRKMPGITLTRLLTTYIRELNMSVKLIPTVELDTTLLRITTMNTLKIPMNLRWSGRRYILKRITTMSIASRTMTTTGRSITYVKRPRRSMRSMIRLQLRRRLPLRLSPLLKLLLPLQRLLHQLRPLRSLVMVTRQLPTTRSIMNTLLSTDLGILMMTIISTHTIQLRLSTCGMAMSM